MDRFSPEQCPLPAVAAVAAAPVVVDILCIIVLSQISAFIMQNIEAFSSPFLRRSYYILIRNTFLQMKHTSFQCLPAATYCPTCIH